MAAQDGLMTDSRQVSAAKNKAKNPEQLYLNYKSLV